MKKHIPNIVTIFNLFCGCFAIMLALGGYLTQAAIMVLLASVFDFFDGFIARLLHVKSDIGKELDSLSDVVSFGVAPAMIIYQLYLATGISNIQLYDIYVIPACISVLFPCFVAFRLAKFNVDLRQTEIFYGLPSPAAAFVIISFVFFEQNKYSFFVYTFVILLLCILMLVNIPLLSLKFKDFKLRNNIFRYILAFAAVIFIAVFGVRAVIFIVLSYFILSFINNLLSKR